MSLAGRWQYPRGLIEPRAPVVLTGAPLQLRGRGLWDPGEQYLGEPEDTIAAARAGDRRLPTPAV